MYKTVSKFWKVKQYRPIPTWIVNTFDILKKLKYQIKLHDRLAAFSKNTYKLIFIF